MTAIGDWKELAFVQKSRVEVMGVWKWEVITYLGKMNDSQYNLELFDIFSNQAP